MKSADTGAGKMFELEMLEPRILLSAAPSLDILAETGATTLTLPDADNVGSIQRATGPQASAANLTQSAPQQVDGIFAGMGFEDLLDNDASSEVQVSASTAS